MELGASFNHHHLKKLKIDPPQALRDFKSLGLKWIRLGCCWNRIETQPGKYQFDELDSLVELSEKQNLNIVMVVGMKSFRWPEYYIPAWIRRNGWIKGKPVTGKENRGVLDRTLEFIRTCVLRYKDSTALKVWQVENEPMDESGEDNLSISSDFLRAEIDSVRNIDGKRKIMVTLWGNELIRRGHYAKLADIADIIGFDLYPRRPTPFPMSLFQRYYGPADSAVTIRGVVDEIKNKGKQFWLTELQAEPWENDGEVTKKENPGSFLPAHLASNFEYAESLDPSVVFLWGYEWWYLRKLKGDPRYWAEAEKLIQKFP